MDPRLLRYYNRELQHLREIGGEFATEFPKIAGRLSLDSFECADPYVERLLEGFAFLAARLQLRIDSEFPRFTQHLFEMVYPQYLSPVPSMVVAQLQPDMKEGSLVDGFVVKRDTPLYSITGKQETTSCTYRTGHDVTLWPIQMAAAKYFGRDSAPVDLPNVPNVKGGIRLLLKTTGGLKFSQLKLDRLPLFLHGSGQIPMQLYEQLLSGTLAIAIRPTTRPAPWQVVLDAKHINGLGFDDREALLPYGPRSFQGYRLLQEYFAFPQRFLFIELSGLLQAVKRCDSQELEILLLTRGNEPGLESYVSADNFALFCAPAVNLFPKTADRIHLADSSADYHVVPDRTRPIDFEVYRIDSVVGYGADLEVEHPFVPFYGSTDATADMQREALSFFTVQRTQRQLSSQQRRYGPRSSYIGTETFIAIVDGNEAPYPHTLRQLAVSTLCTNRDLPLFIPIGKGPTDFLLQTGAPVDSIRCLAGPTKPKASAAYGDGDLVWRLISHLTLNYLSLVNNDERQGAAAIRELLRLYSDANEPATTRQIEGVRSIASKPVTRRIPTMGPITFGRGLEITLVCEDSAFEGSGIFLLGSVLERFFAKYVSINSFTEMTLQSSDRGQIMRWPPRIGRRLTA